jgi:hypothetical protein
LALTPVLVELATWSDKHLRDIHPTIVNGEEMEFLRNDQAAFANVMVTKYRKNWLQHCIQAIAGEVLKSSFVHLVNFCGGGQIIALKSATALIL